MRLVSIYRGWRSCPSRIKGKQNNGCMLRDTVRGGRGTGYVCRHVWCGAEGECAGCDARSLEPRGRRAGEGGVPRVGSKKSREESSRGQGQDYVVREKSAIRGAQDRAAGRQGP